MAARTSEGSLAAALAALRANDYAAARDALIAAWRIRRAPELAELVDALDARAPDSRRDVIRSVITARADTSLDRLRALGPLVDPRLSRVAIDAFARLPFTTEDAGDFVRLLAQTATRHRDPRLATRGDAIVAALVAVVDDPRWRKRVLTLARKAIRAVREIPEPAASERELERQVTELVEPLRTGERAAARLLAEIYASPADDGPRLVYADLLSAANDPRGELIVMQIDRARRGVTNPTPHEQQLLATHGAAWLGDLAIALAPSSERADLGFARGFLAHAHVIPARLHLVIDEPAWATIEALDGLDATSAAFLARAPLLGLRDVALVPSLLATIAAQRDKRSGLVRVRLEVPPAADALAEACPHGVTVTAECLMNVPTVRAYLASGAREVELMHHRRDPAVISGAIREFDALVGALVGTPAPVARLILHPPFSALPRPTPLELHRGSSGMFERAGGTR